MKFVAKLACGMLAFSAATGSANACTMLRSIDARISDGYEQADFTSVLVAKVTDAERAGQRGWKGTAIALGDLTDIPIHPDLDDSQFPEKNKSYTIGRTGESAACDDGVPKPKANDIWVMYMFNDTVRQAYPMLTAYDNDPRLQKEWIIKKQDDPNFPADAEPSG